MTDEKIERSRKVNALKLLAILRQAKPDQETAAAYLLDLQSYPADVLEPACQAIGRQPRSEYEKDWPEVGIIRAKCEAIMRYQREQMEQARPKLTDGDTPLDLEKLKNFKRDVLKSLEQRHSMPKGRS